MSRTLLIAANLKMNPLPAGALEPHSPYGEHSSVEVVLFPSALDLQACIDARLIAGAQAGSAEAVGAFTGDINMQMIAASQARYVLCGHSERRTIHGETDEDVAAQV
ncbi:MAG: triose-phosphate isomerase, partial [Candidatus Peribacteraceae bacterium]